MDFASLLSFRRRAIELEAVLQTARGLQLVQRTTNGCAIKITAWAMLAATLSMIRDEVTDEEGKVKN